MTKKQLETENATLRQELDTLQLGYKAAESSRRLAIVELNSLMDRINSTLHPDDDAPSAPSGCDLVAYVKELREERDYFRNVICHLASLLGREITGDYTAPRLLDDIIKERNMAARIIEKADELAKEMTDLYTPMPYWCYCGAEEKELHKIGCQYEAAMKALAAYQEARHG